MENLLLLSILASGALFLTIMLCFTGKKTSDQQEKYSKDVMSFKLLGLSINIILLLYLVRVVFIAGNGLFSGGGTAVLIGTIVALLPLLLIIPIVRKKPVLKKE